MKAHSDNAPSDTSDVGVSGGPHTEWRTPWAINAFDEGKKEIFFKGDFQQTCVMTRTLSKIAP